MLPNRFLDKTIALPTDQQPADPSCHTPGGIHAANELTYRKYMVAC